MDAWFERGESDDPWAGRQPRYERLVRDGPHFFVDARLPSGEPIRCQLGGFAASPEVGTLIVVCARPARRGVLAQLHNPHNQVCACLAECWCRRSRLGYAVRWYVPARWHRLPPPPPR